MTQNPENSRAQQAIDLILQGKSDEFRATVFELCRELDWPDDDPSFLLAIVGNQLQAMIEQYPERISETMKQAAKELKDDWQLLQTKLISSSLESTKTAHQIDNRLHEVRELLNDEIRKLERLLQQERQESKQVAETERETFMQVATAEHKRFEQVTTTQREDFQKAVAAERETIRVQAGNQAELLTTLFREQSGELKTLYEGKSKEFTTLYEGKKKELEALAVKLAHHATATAQSNVQQHIKEFNKGIKWKYYAEAAAYVCATAAVLVASTWTTAWISRGRANANTPWASIEQWNTAELQACIAAGTPTCNFHIKSPEEEKDD